MSIIPGNRNPKWLHRDYRIVYEIAESDQCVHVLRFRHGSRGYLLARHSHLKTGSEQGVDRKPGHLLT
ncbi:MAG: type II toxin-antitoxin system RelE/ParE family toxin [Verrucomicrobiales bacterium]|nr:type II toxin-antitoxin system RelE/ParE family toxin [Verrucomicrobiales bacterium]